MADNLPQAGEIWERRLSGTLHQPEYAQVRIVGIDERWVYKDPFPIGRGSRQLIHHFLRQYRRVTTTSAAQAAGRE